MGLDDARLCAEQGGQRTAVRLLVDRLEFFPAGVEYLDLGGQLPTLCGQLVDAVVPDYSSGVVESMSCTPSAPRGCHNCSLVPVCPWVIPGR